jgi:hypothetical protein
MESLKDMRTVITIANTAALLGISLYFFRRIKVLEGEIDKHSDDINKQSKYLTSTIKKLKDIQHVSKNLSQIADYVKGLDAKVTQLTSIVGMQNNQILDLQHMVGSRTDKSIVSGNKISTGRKTRPSVQNNDEPKIQTKVNSYYLESASNSFNDLISFSNDNVDDENADDIIAKVQSAKLKNKPMNRPRNIDTDISEDANDFADLGI